MTASLRSVVGLQRMRRDNVFVSTRKVAVDVRGAGVILARASGVKARPCVTSSTWRGCRGLLETRPSGGAPLVETKQACLLTPSVC